jgi:hypothetical protein
MTFGMFLAIASSGLATGAAIGLGMWVIRLARRVAALERER